MRIIKVEEIGSWGFQSGTKYFKSLNKAKKYFKQLIKSHKSELAEDDDCNYQDESISFGDKPLVGVHKSGIRRKRATLECWYSSETDCGTEWDTEPITIVLDEIVIE